MTDQTQPTPTPVSVFYSYAHKDEALREELEKHLSSLRRQGHILEWHDRQIGAGTEWVSQIDEHLETASIILLLISSDFLASDYCYGIEMQRAMKRHKAKEARVIPIILRPVYWKDEPFATLQALPTDGKPVTDDKYWSTPDHALSDVAEGIRQVVHELRALSQAPSYLQASQSNLPTERTRSPIIATPLVKPPSTTPAGNIMEFLVPTSASGPWGITAGPDGNLWFTESAGNKIGRVSTSGIITEFPLRTSFLLRTSKSGPLGITAGPDGNLWFTENGGNKIGRITTSGIITEFPFRTSKNGLWGITAGPDGNLWFTDNWGCKIGRISTSGTITEFPLRTLNCPCGITAGPDGNLWFTESAGNNIGRISTTGVITEFPLRTSENGVWRNVSTEGITAGPDGNLWFTEDRDNTIGRITTSGKITEFPLPYPHRGPHGITAGPDGNLWFTERDGHKIGRITTSGTITEFPLPPSASDLFWITMGPDDNLWFTEHGGNKIGCITSGK